MRKTTTGLPITNLKKHYNKAGAHIGYMGTVEKTAMQTQNKRPCTILNCAWDLNGNPMAQNTTIGALIRKVEV